MTFLKPDVFLFNSLFQVCLFVLFCYVLLFSPWYLFFSNGRQKGGESREHERWVGTRRRRKYNQDTLSENIYLLIFILYVYLPACMCVYHVCAGLIEARKGIHISWSWSYRRLWATMLVLGVKPRSFREQPVLIYAEHLSSPHVYG